MLVNVTKMKFERSINFPKVQDIEIKTWVEGYDNHVSSWVAEEDFPLVIAALTGNRYPFVSDDNIYLTRFRWDGLTHMYFTSFMYKKEYDAVRRTWATFSGSVVAGLLLEFQKSNDMQMVLDEEFWAQEKASRAPVVEFVFSTYGDDDEESVIQTYRECMNHESFQQSIKGLEAIATNSSHGELVEVRMRYDHPPREGVPMSWFWNVVNTVTGRSIMHGGVIAHRNGKGYEYSTHT